jgi:very-short-patch-repair endonuclease
VHEAANLDPVDVRDLDGLRVTSPARTVLDLAAIGHRSLEAVFAEMLAQRVLRERELEAALTRVGKRPGVVLVRSLLGANRRGFTRSEAERRLRKLCRAGRLPEPMGNMRIAGWEVDVVWPEHRLVIEVDGYTFHGHRVAFERDRRKDQALMTAGYRVVRVTWRQLVDEPLAVLVVIATALSAGPSTNRNAH